jgi:hypothetical protein
MRSLFLRKKVAGDASHFPIQKKRRSSDQEAEASLHKHAKRNGKSRQFLEFIFLAEEFEKRRMILNTCDARWNKILRTNGRSGHFHGSVGTAFEGAERICGEGLQGSSVDPKRN